MRRLLAIPARKRSTTLGLVMLAVVLVAVGCSGSNGESQSAPTSEAAPADNVAIPSAYFEAMQAWSAEVNTRMDAIEQPSNDNPLQHAEFYQRQMDTQRDLRNNLAGIEPTAATADAHRELLDRMQAILDLDQRIIDSLRDASSAGAVLGPLSGETEIVSGLLLQTCSRLLDIARSFEIQVQLFCGHSNE